jgi:hypothetical protein
MEEIGQNITTSLRNELISENFENSKWNSNKINVLNRNLPEKLLQTLRKKVRSILLR